MQVSVVQIGARNHYITASTLDSMQRLKALYTDVYLTKASENFSLTRLIKFCSPVYANILANRKGDIDDYKVKSYWRFACYGIARRYLTNSLRIASRIDVALAKGLARHAMEDCFAGADVVYGYSGGAKELFIAAKQQGVKTILDQASASVQTATRIMSVEAEKWEGWEEYLESKFFELYKERQEVETELADMILVPSLFVKQSLEDVGVNSKKIHVVPYGLQIKKPRFQLVRRRHDQPLKVLFVGNVSVQKGIPYLLESAERMRHRGVEFRVVGPLQIKKEKLDSYSSFVDFTGRVSRDKVSEHYQWADVLCLPSLCEGFGLVQVEALTHGLPVITTTNAGEVVRDGVEGFVVPPADINSLCNAIEKMIDKKELLEKFSLKAKERFNYFSYDNYMKRLSSVLRF